MRIRFIIPGDINTPTGGYRYDRSILHEWKKQNVAVDLVSVPGTYPKPRPSDKELAFDILNECDEADVTVIDGLAGGGFPDLLAHSSRLTPCISLLHHPLCLENGISQKDAALLEESERAGLEFVKAVITTSPATSKTIAKLFDYPKSAIHSVEPGVERAKMIDFRTHEPLSILSVGSISERKGHDVLIKALAAIHHLPWRLTVIGPQNIDTKLFRALTALCQSLGIEERVQFLDGLSDSALHDHFDEADIFALASRYEGYGMAYAEAIVRGIPVIGTTAGAIPDTVPEQAGLLVAPDDIDALSNALTAFLTDEPLRRQKHEGARLAEPDFPTWSGSAKAIMKILEGLV